MSKNLWELKKNEKCRVSGFKKSLAENYRVRLMELGFSPGKSITCMHAPKLGAPKLYQVNSTCYSLDDRIAKLIETDLK